MTNTQELKNAVKTAQINLKIALDNLAFEKLTPAQKRVTIAKDVIAQVKLGKIKAQRGTYVEHGVVEGNKIDSCTACALGSLFACAIDKPALKNFVEEEIGLESGDTDFYYDNQSEMQQALSPYFDVFQLELVESAFEQTATNIDSADYEEIVTGEDSEWRITDPKIRKLVDKAVAFGNKFVGSKQRLIAIMQNIVTNKGTFKP